MTEEVMVTGGAGFIGSHLVERLLSEGKEVFVFDSKKKSEAMNLSAVTDCSNLHYFHGDMRKPESIREFYRPKATTLYHLASTVGVHFYMEDPLSLIDIVVGGTRVLVDLAIRNETRFLFASTSEVFGKNPAVPWSEEADRVLGPTTVDRWSYSSGKAVCEHMLNGASHSHKLPMTITRFFNAYGPRQNPYYVISQSVQKVLNREPPLLYDDGLQTRCFTYVDDLIDGVLKASRSPMALGESFNLGNPIETTMAEVIGVVIARSGVDIEPISFDTGKEYGAAYEDVPRRVPDPSKAKEVLEWTPITSLESGIDQTLDWAKQNPWWLDQ